MNHESVRPADVRLRRWDVKFKSDWAKQLVDEQREEMRKQAARKFSELVHCEQSAKAVLSLYPISVSSVASYLCFVRELWKLDRKYQARLRDHAAQERLEKWEKRGLDPEVLTDLAYKVFSIVIGSRREDRPTEG